MRRMMHFYWVPSGRNRLAASVDLPDRVDGPLPTVIVVHGLTGQRIGHSYHLVEFGRRLSERAIACIRFDQAGSGESTGQFESVTIRSMVDDTRAVRAWAADQTWCDPDRLAFVGLSLGALPVVQCDADAPARALALWAPVYDMPRVFKQTAKTGLRALLTFQGWVPYRGVRIGRRFVDLLDAVDTDACLAASNATVLICHSRIDDVVSHDEGRAYVERCAALGRPHELLSFRNADHDFGEYPDRQRLLTRTITFLSHGLGAERS
jgi:alpha-beta hydrolase superfamily lysophospholipase